jgi:hypothetical protein
VHQPVEMTSGFLNLLAHVIIAIKVEDVGDKVKSILIVLDVGVEAGEIEAVGQVVFVNLAEILVAAGGDELEHRRKVSVLNRAILQ